MAIKHPIRDLFLFWMGKRLLKRHERKKEAQTGMRSGRPFGSTTRTFK